MLKADGESLAKFAHAAGTVRVNLALPSATQSSALYSSASSKKSKHSKLSMQDVNAAVKIAQQREEKFDADHSAIEDLGPIIIKDGISLKEVREFILKKDKLPFRVCFVPDQPDMDEEDPRKIIGKYIAYDLPRDVHETTASKIVNQVIEEILSSTNSIAMIREFVSTMASTTQIGLGLKEPDGGLRPVQLAIGGNVLNAGFGRPFPNLVVEVAYKHESLLTLQNELHAWIGNNTSVQVAIGIKIFGLRKNGSCRMLALLYRRGVAGPTQSVEFGTNIGNAAGLNLSFPLADLYFGVAQANIPLQVQPLIANGAVIVVDLAQLQASILLELSF